MCLVVNMIKKRRFTHTFRDEATLHGTTQIGRKCAPLKSLNAADGHKSRLVNVFTRKRTQEAFSGMPPSLSAFGGLLFSVIAFVYSLLKAAANGKEHQVEKGGKIISG